MMVQEKLKTRLIYDSQRSGTTVGVRAVITAGRSLVFRGGDLTVDVTIHSSRHSWGYHYGQVIRHSDGSPVAGVDVVLDDGDSVQTDECGQFAIATTDTRAASQLLVHSDEATLVCELPAAGPEQH